MSISYVIHTKPGCPFCDKAKDMLTVRGLAYTVNDHRTPDQIAEFKAMGFVTFPQVFEVRAGTLSLIGGSDKLEGYLAELDDF